MRLTFLGIILPLWAICTPLAAAQEAEGDENERGRAQAVGQPAEDKLSQMLDDMAKTQDDDSCAAASHVLEQTGDELAFHARMKEKAAQEHPVAMFWLARSLRGNESPYQDEDVAARFLELVMKAAAKDYQPAMVQAAQALYYGGETEEARTRGMDMLMRACKMGSAKARACYLVMSGKLVDKDSDLEAPEVATELKHHNYYVEEIVAEAHWGDMEWLKTAAEHGSAWAAYELSLRGHLRDRDSLAYLRMAAERHMPEAMTTLGCLLCLGPLPGGYTPQHPAALPEKAIPMASAESDAQPAGQESPNVTPSAESIEEGMQLLRRATSMGDERAAAFLALAYAGGMGKDIAPDRIAALFRYAHERELPYGTAGWGYCLVAGKGCKQNVPQGLALLEQVAKQGVAWADLALSHLYKNGIGVERNEAKAAEYRKAFDQQETFSPFIPTEPEAELFPALK